MSEYNGFIIEDNKLALKRFTITQLKKYEVLIKVKAIGVNYADLLQKKGHYPPPTGASLVLGLEVAGTIVDKGKNVTEFAVHDRIMALLEGGGYAEYVIADSRFCLKIPDSISFQEAAIILETFTCVWFNLFIKHKFKIGSTVLVHGGSGGIGTTVIQLVKHFGGKVIATCGSDDKCQKCLSIGANIAINYTKHNFTEVILNNYPKGIDLIIDTIGAKYFEDHIKILKPYGKIICIGTMGGVKANINLLQIIKNKITIIGSVLRTLETKQKRKAVNSLAKNVLPLFERGIVKPIIWQEFKFLAAEEAIEALERRDHFGKIVLSID